MARRNLAKLSAEDLAKLSCRRKPGRGRRRPGRLQGPTTVFDLGRHYRDDDDQPRWEHWGYLGSYPGANVPVAAAIRWCEREIASLLQKAAWEEEDALRAQADPWLDVDHPERTESYRR